MHTPILSYQPLSYNHSVRVLALQSTMIYKRKYTEGWAYVCCSLHVCVSNININIHKSPREELNSKKKENNRWRNTMIKPVLYMILLPFIWCKILTNKKKRKKGNNNNKEEEKNPLLSFIFIFTSRRVSAEKKEKIKKNLKNHKTIK